MEFFKIIGVGLITLFLSLVLKQIKPEFAILVSVVGGCIIFLMLVSMLGSIFNEISKMISVAGIDGELFGVLLKVVGIGYITEFSADICTDSGHSSLANKIQLGGKITILFLALPIFRSIFEIITGLIK